MELPFPPGKYCFVANFWRLINPYNNLSAFKEIFLGQAVDFIDFKSVGIFSQNNDEWVCLIFKTGC